MKAKPKPKPQPTSALSAPDGFNTTPLGNSHRFLRDYSDTLRWVEGIGINSAGSFYWWDGMRWQENNSKPVELAQQTVRDLNKLVALAVKQQLDPREVEQLVAFWKRSEADYEVKEILSLPFHLSVCSAQSVSSRHTARRAR
jgi:hypothetical protein